MKKLFIADWPHFTLCTILACFGLVMVYSASSVQSYDLVGHSFFYLKKQSLFFILGIGICLSSSQIPPRFWLRLSPLLLLVSLILTSLVFIPGIGESTNGSARWVRLFGLRFQPSEILKVSFLLYACHFFEKSNWPTEFFFRDSRKIFAICGITLTVVLLQPDLGSTFVIASLLVTLLFLAGTKLKYLFSMAALAIPSLIVLIISSPYRKRRLLSFLDPWADPQNTSYQIVQSFASFFKGGFWGQGLGNSQEKLYFLPEAPTDFIAAIIAEELGVFGFLAMILVFTLFIYRSMSIAANSASKSSFLLAGGASFLLGSQVVLNLGVVLGLLPTKGLTLPFISAGGSSLMTCFFCCALIQSVAKENEGQV